MGRPKAALVVTDDERAELIRLTKRTRLNRAVLNRLIELNKQFSFMEYPNRRHGISGLHIDTLRWSFITTHLPAGPR